jgi:DNA-nicking Smr family endonuclease
MSRRRRGLTDDDLAHWRQVARTAEPLRAGSGPGARREGDGMEAFDAPSASREAPRAPRQPPLRPFRIGESAGGQTAGHDLSPTLERRLAGAPVTMDARTFSRLKRGKLRPERKIDLHGMTLAQAHPALERFIRRAHGEGLRLVLVVTGKGRSGRDEGGPIPTPRGLLRHHVPGWLAAPTLRPHVLQVTDAHARHGGAGAYYVYLRRAR